MLKAFVRNSNAWTFSAAVAVVLVVFALRKLGVITDNESLKIATKILVVIGLFCGFILMSRRFESFKKKVQDEDETQRIRGNFQNRRCSS